MDYLPNVTVEPARQPLVIPYLCALDEPLEYPSGDAAESYLTEDDDMLTGSGLPAHDIAASIQKRMFLELVGEAIGNDSLLKATSLNPTGSGWPVLSVATLPIFLDRLRTKRSPSLRGVISSGMESRLRDVATKVRQVLLKIELDHNSAWEIAAIQPLPAVLLSVQALVETIWDAQFLPMVWPLKNPVRRPNPFFVDNGFVSALLNKSGWLSNDIAELPKDIRIRYYLSFFKQQTEKSERRVSINQRPLIKECYSAQHTNEGCECLSLSAIISEVENLGPIFNIVSLDEDPADQQLRVYPVSVTSSQGRPSFVAFSHVRSDGLGSSHSNSLPRCQLLYLQRLSNELLPNSPAPVPFYIDTLSVPLRGRAKRSALRNIQNIFRIADKVLVLDSGLRTTPLGQPQENLARIRYSVWAKRLWTVQECAVTLNVSFHFLNQNLSLGTFLHTLETDTEYPLLQTQSMKDRNLAGFTDDDYARLSTALALLSDDMQLAESLRHMADQEMKPQEGYDKSRLRTILRLGLLALPHMRYFPEAHESAQFQNVASGVLKEYDGLEADWERRWEMIREDPTALYARLKKIQSLELAVDS